MSKRTEADNNGKLWSQRLNDLLIAFRANEGEN